MRKLGKLPTMAEYEMHGSYSVRPLIRRYGGWVHVPAGLMEFARKERLEGEWGDVLDVIARHREEESDGRRTSGSTNGRMPRPRILKDRPIYGAPMMDMALGLAPTNEMGVVFLFGTLAKEMGFMVIRLQMEFPDCEAFWEVEPGRWQLIRVEFEYESRNFLIHKHRLEDCDLIVCWKNNWEGCPLQVIELSTVMEALTADKRG